VSVDIFVESLPIFDFELSLIFILVSVGVAVVSFLSPPEEALLQLHTNKINKALSAIKSFESRLILVVFAITCILMKGKLFYYFFPKNATFFGSLKNATITGRAACSQAALVLPEDNRCRNPEPIVKPWNAYGRHAVVLDSFPYLLRFKI
jgi:hypothetical protein